jgi:hypothetical protein
MTAHERTDQVNRLLAAASPAHAAGVRYEQAVIALKKAAPPLIKKLNVPDVWHIEIPYLIFFVSPHTVVTGSGSRWASAPAQVNQSDLDVSLSLQSMSEPGIDAADCIALPLKQMPR